MESMMWCYLFWAAIAALAVAVLGLLALAFWFRRREREMDPGGREVYIPYQTPDFDDSAAGFCLRQLPRSELLVPTSYWLVDAHTVQVVYNVVPAQQVFLRLAAHSRAGVPRAAAYRDEEYQSSTVCQVNGVSVLLRQTAGGFCSASWSCSGYDYLLYGPALQMNAIGGMLAAFVNGVTVQQST